MANAVARAWGEAPPSLQDGDVHIWRCTLDSDTDSALLERFGALLDDSEHRRHRRLIHARDRCRFLSSHAFLRLVLSLYTRVAPEAWRFVTNADGKPFVAGPQAQQAPFFNLSHSGSLALLALARAPCEIGVDIERHHEPRRFHALARRNFAPSEAMTLDGLYGPALVRQFYDLWSLKESFVKARGLGLRMPLDGFWFDHDAETATLHFDASPVCDTNPAMWSFCSYRLNDRYSAAVAISRSLDRAPSWFDAQPWIDWRPASLPMRCQTRRNTDN